MKRTNFWFDLFMLAGGIALIVTHNTQGILHWLIQLLGWFFAIPGAIMLLLNLFGSQDKAKASGGRTFATLSAVGSLIIGLVMIIWPEALVGVFVYVLAALLIAIGVWQIVGLAMVGRPIIMPWWLYILPVLTFVAGLLLIVTPLKQTAALFTLVAGIAMTCYGINGVFAAATYYGETRGQRRLEHTDEKAIEAPRPENEL